MATSQRLFDRATDLATAAMARLGRELRDARRDRGLSIAAAARAAGVSTSELSRIERGESTRVPFITLHRCAAVIGLDLSSRLYPGAGPLRDEAHAALLANFRAHVHRSISWATEVPLPIAGDLRAWDALLGGRGWRYGVEAETAPRDAQALNRRLQLKSRDGGVDGVLLVLRDSRSSRRFVREAAIELGPSFPQSGVRAMELLRAGVDPGGSAIVFVAWARTTSRPTGQPTGATAAAAGSKTIRLAPREHRD